MKSLEAVWLLLCVAGLSQTAPKTTDTMGTHATSQAKTVVIRAGTLIDGTSAQPKKNHVIEILCNEIVSVGDAGQAQASDDSETIGPSQASAPPGLNDSPTHLFP